MQSSMRRHGAVLLAGLAAFAMASAALAQAPPPYPPPPPPAAAAPVPPASPEAAEIAACLCLWQSVNALSAEMNARQQSYNAIQDELTRLDGELQTERARIDVNNPQSVAHFRQLLEQRDAAFRRSTTMATGDLADVTARYNARTNEYNARCANRPRDPRLVASVQATLACPPPN